MEQLLSILSEPILGTIIGLIGIFIALYFYKKSKFIKRLSYQINEIVMIGRKGAAFGESLEIIFAGRKVDKVTKTEIIIWNSGNITIDGNGIIESDPISIILSDEFEILQCDIISYTRKVNGCTVKILNNNTILLNFEFLDENDGFKLSLFHSGEAHNVSVRGTVRGMPGGISLVDSDDIFVKIFRRLPPESFRRISRFLSIFLAAAGISMSIFGIMAYKFNNFNFNIINNLDNEQIPGIFFILGALYASMPIYLLWSRRRRYPSKLDEDSN